MLETAFAECWPCKTTCPQVVTGRALHEVWCALRLRYDLLGGSNLMILPSFIHSFTHPFIKGRPYCPAANSRR